LPAYFGINTGKDEYILKKTVLIPVVLAVQIILHTYLSTTYAQWTDLFNGSDLGGWVQYGGMADYFVEDGILYGVAVPDSPNSFLATRDTYSDFILEFEFLVDPLLNSGVQIRSAVNERGRVYGYQVEIDPSERSWSAGIYDEARRGWMYPLYDNKPGQEAFRQGGWNIIRVEALGPSIRTWINGVEAANLLDDETSEGLIALQVHSINDAGLIGIDIAFRSVRIITENPELHQTPASDLKQYNFVPNTLSEAEKADGWKLLWDGESTRGWRSARHDDFPRHGWTISDGVLTVEASGGGESANGGDIITVEMYRDFDLIVDFNITEGANSGIKYFVNPAENPDSGSSLGCEFQILDDRRHPDAAHGVKGNRTMASLYDLIPAQNKRFMGPGQWSRARILVHGRHVEHWLNGIKVLEYERGTQMWRALVNFSKFVDHPNFGNAEYGHILLQDHGDNVSFRSIKIKEL
jgi:hypothetical protein